MAKIGSTVSSNVLGSELAKVLGLPDQIISFSLKFRAAHPAVVECEFLPSQLTHGNTQDQLKSVLATYQLVEAPSVEELNFDAWMAARVQAAHSELLRTYERLSIMDWLAAHPELPVRVRRT